MISIQPEGEKVTFVPDTETLRQDWPPTPESADYAVFDIETAPLDDDVLRSLMPPFEPKPHPGEFDESLVRYGNTKDKDKRAEKLKEEREKHAAAVRDYDATVDADEAEHFYKFRDKAALDATTGRVVAIGVSPWDANGQGIIDCDGDQEDPGLRQFWWWIDKNIKAGRPTIGHNIFSFDLPMLARRSWICGVPVPITVRQGRNWNPLFIDTMSAWTFGKYGEYVKLDTIAKAFGLVGKVTEVDGQSIEGKSFYLAWRDPERRATAEKYLLRDLELPGIIARKIGIV